MRTLSKLVLSAGLLALLPAHVAAADAKSPTPYRGKFISYDAQLRTLRVADSRADITFVVDPNVKFTIDDNQPTDRKLTELPTDCYVSLTLNADRSTVLELNALGPMRQVTIEAIDVDTGTIRVVDKKKNAETFKFSKDVKVTNDKSPGSLTDLKPGGKLQMKVSVDKTKAMSIRLLASKS